MIGHISFCFWPRAGSLEALDLGEHTLDAGAVAAIGRMPALQELRLQACSVANGGGALLRLALPRLRVLDLCWAELSRDDAPHPPSSSAFVTPPRRQWMEKPSARPGGARGPITACSSSVGGCASGCAGCGTCCSSTAAPPPSCGTPPSPTSSAEKTSAHAASPEPFEAMPSLRSLNLNFAKGLDGAFFAALARHAAPRLERLLLCSLPSLVGSCAAVLGAAPQLAMLALGQQAPAAEGAAVWAAIGRMQALTELWLPGCRLSDVSLDADGTAAAAQAAASATAAACAAAASSSGGGGEASALHASAPRGCMPPPLVPSAPVTLPAGNNAGSEAAGWHALLARLPQLRTLNISDSDAGGAALRAVLQLTRLRSLQMRFIAALNDDDLAALADGCAALQNLELQVRLLFR